MAKKIEILLTAKNLLARGLNRASKALKAFSKSAARIGKMFAVGFAAAGAALIAFGVKAMNAFKVQETAERRLISALETHGEVADDLMPKLKALASAIQDQTGVADEQTLANMALMKTLGIETDKLGAAAKGVIALTAAGMGQAQASRAMAAAADGDYLMLTRYIPALKTASDETKKAALLNDFLSKSYDAQKKNLNSTEGAWVALKGRVGDFMEAVGEAINKNGAIQGLLQRMSIRVKALTADVGALIDALTDVDTRQSTGKAIAGVIVAAFAVAGERSVSVLKMAAPIIGDLIGKAAKAAFSGKRGGEMSAAVSELKAEGVIGRSGRKQGITRSDQRDMINQRTDEIHIRNLEMEGKAAAATAKNIDGLTKAEANLVNKLRAVKQIIETNKAANKDAAKSSVDVVETAIEQIRVAERNVAKEELAAKRDTERAKLKETKAAATAEIEMLRKVKAAKEAIAKETVRSYIDGIRNKRKADAQWVRDQARAERLRGQSGRGATDFVSAVDAIRGAREGAPAMAANLKAAEANAQQLDMSRNRSLSTMTSELKGIRKDNAALMAAG